MSARFHVDDPPAVALAVLTDYENIPRFLPDVTFSTSELTARPSFDVPEFILKRLLKRDSTRTIERLSAEIAARATRQSQ